MNDNPKYWAELYDTSQKKVAELYKELAQYQHTIEAQDAFVKATQIEMEKAKQRMFADLNDPKKCVCSAEGACLAHETTAQVCSVCRDDGKTCSSCGVGFIKPLASQSTQDPIKAEFKRSCPRCGKSQVGTYATPNRDPQATVYWHADGTPDSCESSNTQVCAYCEGRNKQSCPHGPQEPLQNLCPSCKRDNTTPHNCEFSKLLSSNEGAK